MSVGLICEFNPFHFGHRYIIRKALELSGEPVICVMSGPFTQRAEPACTDKYARTEAALKGGAAAVIELPVRFAVSAAKDFARGGVAVLKNIKNVSALAFGVETDEPELLYEIAEIKKRPETDEAVKKLLGQGKSYPSALCAAISSVNSKYNEVLAFPNNVLAVEYIEALSDSGIAPLPIKRVGNYSDNSLKKPFASASAIRENLGKTDLSEYLPAEMIESCLAVKPDLRLFENLLLYAIRKMPTKLISELPGVEQGLAFAIKNAAYCPSFKSMLEELKSGRYTYSRLKRIFICSLLGITNQVMSDINSIKTRVLGIKEESKCLFKDLSSNIIVRNSEADDSFRNDKSIQIDAFASDVYSLLTGSRGNLYYTSPIIII